MSSIARLDAFALRDSVIGTYKDYARGFITIADPKIRHEVEDELTSGRLWPDPYVQINPRYAQSDTVDDLVSEGMFHPQMADVFGGLTFYEHQTEAFRLAEDDIPFVVTTGTGSGKSLTYMAPIINDVLNNVDRHGIRAIIVYPMNALANSQYEALKEFLPGGCMNEALDDDGVFDPGKITNDATFGRYTGPTKRNVRDAMVERPPNILLTNYVMLELLLTRVWDRNLLGNADRLKWLVLDELHTYRGRQGADVGMLLRRVKHTAGRLKNVDGPRDIVHIGTSATMAAGDDVSPEDARKEVASAATTLFGAHIDPDHVIGETLVRTTPLASGDAAAVKAALSGRSWAAPTDWPTFENDPVASFVETLVGSAPNDEGVLVRSKPMRAEQIAERLADIAGFDLDDSTDGKYVSEVVREILRAGNTIVVDKPGERPTAAFPFRLHQFVTRGDNVFSTVDPPASREITLEEQEFLPGDRGRSLFNVAFCRECGFEYLPVEQWVRPEDGVTVYSRRDPYERSAVHDPSDGVRGFLFVPRGDVDWPRIGYDDKNYRDPDVLDRVPDEWKETTDAGTRHVRGSRNTSPRKYLPEPVTIDGNGVTNHGPDANEVFFMPAPFKRCLACGVEYGGGWSDLPRLATLGLSGRSTATTILTLSVLEYLAEHREQAEREGLDAAALLPKLLNFTDNRQDASLQSGHFNDFIQTVSLRAALVRAIDHAHSNGTDLTVENVAAAVLEQTGLTLDDYGVDVTDKQAAFPVGKTARKTMLDLIRHRIMVDAGGGKSLTQPNLENVGLATIDYVGLDALAAADDMWAEAAADRSKFVDQQDSDREPDPTLAKTSHLVDATPEEREHVARTLLDYLRRNHIVRDKGLDPEHLSEMKWQIGERIQSPFDGGIDKDSRLTEWSMMAARGRVKGQPGWVLDLPPAPGEETSPDEASSVGEIIELPGLSDDRQTDDTPADALTDTSSESPEAPAARAAITDIERFRVEQVGPPGASGQEDIARVPIAVAGTLAAGFVLTLDRLRRARLRRRQPQHRIPLPEGEEATAEQQLRAHSDPHAARLLDLALRELSDHQPTPRVVLVSHGPADVTVHLDSGSDAPPHDWQCHGGGRMWSRHRPMSLDSLEMHAGTPSRFPAMVTIGELPAGRVGLLNLARTGCLHLDGEDQIVRQLLAAWALELATTRRADALEVITTGFSGPTAGLERITHLDDPSQLEDLLSQPHANDPTNTPGTVVLAAGLPAHINVLLRTTSEFRPDLVAVTADLEPRSGDWSLRLEAGGRARLEPEGTTFDLLDLGAETVPMTAKLIEQALHDPDQLVPFPGPDATEPPPLDEPNEDSEDAAVAAVEAVADEPATEVRVLGPVEVVGTVEPFRTNKTIELIVYLALHRTGADADTLLEALWPEQEPRPARLYTEASRARKSLGTAPDGSPHLPGAELGRYQLAASVGVDYERFTARVAAARRDPARAAEHLRAALMLVRGMPLSATTTEYAWATNEIYGLIQEVVDAAHDLAQRCLAAERYDDAVWAAERGLLADPLAEVLVRDLMRASAASGNTARVHAAMTRLRRQVGEGADGNDADDWLHTETTELFARLTGPTLSEPRV